MKELTFGPDSTIRMGSSEDSAVTELLIQASRMLSSPRPPWTLCPIIRRIASASVGRPAWSQFTQMRRAFTRLLSTEVCGLVAARSAAKRRASSRPNTSTIARALLAYQPRFARPA